MKPLNIPNQVADATFENLGDLCERFHGRLFLSPFNVAYVISREINLFGQLLLTQASFFSSNADGLSQDFINSTRRMHFMKSKQNSKTELPTIGWYLFCLNPCHWEDAWFKIANIKTRIIALKQQERTLVCSRRFAFVALTYAINFISISKQNHLNSQASDKARTKGL